MPQVRLLRWIKQQSLRQRDPEPGVMYSQATHLPAAEGSQNSRSYPGLFFSASPDGTMSSASQKAWQRLQFHLTEIDFCFSCVQARYVIKTDSVFHMKSNLVLPYRRIKWPICVFCNVVSPPLMGGVSTVCCCLLTVIAAWAEGLIVLVSGPQLLISVPVMNADLNTILILHNRHWLWQ